MDSVARSLVSLYSLDCHRVGVVPAAGMMILLHVNATLSIITRSSLNGKYGCMSSATLFLFAVQPLMVYSFSLCILLLFFIPSLMSCIDTHAGISVVALTVSSKIHFFVFVFNVVLPRWPVCYE